MAKDTVHGLQNEIQGINGDMLLLQNQMTEQMETLAGAAEVCTA